LPDKVSQAKKQNTMNNDSITSSLFDEDDRIDPLEWIEHYLIEENIGFERSIDGDLSFAIEGAWRRFDLWFSYRPEGDALQLCCSIDLDPQKNAPKTQRIGTLDTKNASDSSQKSDQGISDYQELNQLLILINQHVWFGHFDLVPQKPELGKSANLDSGSPENKEIVFRLTLPFGAMEAGSTQHFAFMVHAVTETVERFLPAFELWHFDRLNAYDAFAACLFETQGEA
jgi:hypothetical protein